MSLSIVVPVKNAGSTVGRTLKSLRDQTSDDFEVIIVDGGSTDATHDVIKGAGLRSCRLIIDEGSGITRAVNRGISAASGKIIMPWLCADDYLDNRFVETVTAELADDIYDFSYGNWHVVEAGSVIKSRRPDTNWAAKMRYYMPLILPNTFVFRSDLLAKVGDLDESLRFANDYDLLRRVQQTGAVGRYCHDAWYYFQTGGISQARHFECAKEVARTAIKHGSGSLPTLLHSTDRYVRAKVSFFLNRYRRTA